MPFDSTRSRAIRVTRSMSMSFCSSSWIRYSSASSTRILRFLERVPNMAGISSLMFIPISSKFGPPPMSKLGPRSFTSSSTMRSSSLPDRRRSRSFSRDFAFSSGFSGVGGSRRSKRRLSAAVSARSPISSSFSSRTMSMAISTRSRIIDSTSRPTYPTSVNLLASTFMKGELESLARRRAISVFPTPVGPIMRMFLGITSSAISGGSFWRRSRLRRAMATARLASGWPMTYLSSSRTISRGVSSSRTGPSSTDWLGR